MAQRSRKRNYSRTQPRMLPTYRWNNPTLASDHIASVPIQHLTAEGKTTTSDFPITRVLASGRLLEVFNTSSTDGTTVNITPRHTQGAFSVSTNNLICRQAGTYYLWWHGTYETSTGVAAEQQASVAIAGSNGTRLWRRYLSSTGTSYKFTFEVVGAQAMTVGQTLNLSHSLSATGNVTGDIIVIQRHV